MNSKNLSRRKFLAAASAGTIAAVTSGTTGAYAKSSAGKLAIKGGKAVRTKPFQSWPIWDRSAEKDIISILRSGDWFRGRGETVTKFEKAYADILGAKRCVCTVNGTNALLTAMHALDVGVGDEVIVSPYTFIATYNVVIGSSALPVFADTDPETFQSWPIWDRSAEKDIVSILRSGNWFRGRGQTVTKFENAYAEMLGAKRCVCTVNGTNALLTAMHVLDIGVGDEVIVSPYTFIATYNVIIGSSALPVFADTDPETFQINPDKIEERITERTRAIMPVHILGLPANMDRIMAIAKKHNLIVIEDACQAWMAEWRGKKLGTIGDLGCFSFQNSKHLPIGEGGAVVGNDEELMDRVHSYHNCGRPFGCVKGHTGYPVVGTNRRMTEYQAAVGLSQIKRLEGDTERRNKNAEYLTSKIKDIPGIVPHRLYDGVTRCAYHLYPFRYKKEYFNGAPRQKFLAALSREGIPCSGGYGPQYKDELIEVALESKNFKRSFPKSRLDQYRRELNYPDNDQLCKEAVWLSQTLLLGKRRDMDDIANAIAKVAENKDQLA